MLVYLVVNVPDNYIDDAKRQGCPDVVQVHLGFGDRRRGLVSGFEYFSRDFFVGNDSVADTIALRIVNLLREWAGEKPLSVDDVRVGPQKGDNATDPVSPPQA